MELDAANQELAAKLQQMGATKKDICKSFKADFRDMASSLTLLDTLKILSAPDAGEALYITEEQACKQRLKLSPPPKLQEDTVSWFFPGSSQSRMIGKIDEQLNKKNLLSVGYNYSFSVTGTGGSHASTLVARRWQNNKCEYLLRNADGPVCQNPDTKKDLYKFPCDAGNVWVPKEELEANLHSINYLQP